jgi:hypothetical protein
MTWWMRLVHAASDRWDAWRKRRDATFDADLHVVEIRRLAAIAPHVPAQRTGRRYQGRHAKPKDFGEGT